MKTLRNIVVVLACLVLAGLAKLPYDQRLEADMLQRGLLPEPIALDTREKLGQTSVAIALGGLRSVIATMMNIGAHVHWENQEWYELEQDYQTIVTLQPKTRYYWTVAAWHLYSNAYADYERKPAIPDGSRKRKQREFFDRGISFLDGGIKANPDDWRLLAEKGNALSQWWRPRDLDQAAEAYRAAFALKANLQVQRNYLYTLSRIRGREADAWKIAQEVWAFEPNRRFPSPRTIFFALQNWADPPLDKKIGVVEIFQSPLVAADDVPNYWFRQKEGYPMHGVAVLLDELCEQYQIPASIRPHRFDPELKFSFHPISGEPFGLDPVTKKPVERTWTTIWTGAPSSHYHSILRIHTHLFRAGASGKTALSPKQERSNRVLAARDLALYWLHPKEGYPLDRMKSLLEDLCEEFRIPPEIRPIRFDPARSFTRHPLTRQPLAADQTTGTPGEKTWGAIWTEDLRPVYENHLKQFLEPNR